MGSVALNFQERIELAINLGESHFREFKSALEGPSNDKHPRDIKLVASDIGETLVAFANADGGELLVGVEDDGKVSGLTYPDKKIEILLNAPKTHVHQHTPLPGPKSSVIEYENKKILYFQVPKGADFIYLTSDGRCLQRKDRYSMPISTEQISFSRNEIISREYDRKFVENAKLSDLDISLVTTIANHLSGGMSPEKCLQHLELAEYDGSELKLRKAALLLFANKINRWHPRVQVRILKIDGTEILTGENYNVKSDEETTENIIKLIDTSWDLLRPHLTETRFLMDAKFRNQIIYPELACREALINAIAHRDYSIEGAGIEVHVYSDRMEIRSPGGLLSSIRLQDIQENKGVHQSRNSLIARVLREIGYMRELGEGIRRIFELMKLNDLAKPEFESDTNYFNVILHHRYIYSKEQKLWLDSFADADLSREQKTIVLLGYNNHIISPNEIWEAVGITDTDYYRQLLQSLYDKEILTRIKTRNQVIQEAKKKNFSRKSIPQFKVQIPAVKTLQTKPMNIENFVSEIKVGSKIFVDNVPYGCKSEELQKVFQRFGEVTKVDLPLDWVTGFQRGFAFIEFEDLLSADKALNFKDPLVLADRKLVIRKYLAK
jgi:ATP-dependent DNA helicase RecG